ncbi:MAG: NnrS family protein [Myxococcaceae bacterium]|nr:NnrS family protein [Myxococcaceae bacterium]
MRLPIAGQVDAPAVGALRKDPYRLFFPLGVLLGWAGVGQWLWFSLVGGQFRVVFHAMVQVEGFLGCFIAGFLFTFIPRRTATDPPATWQLAIAALCPVLLAVFA